MKQILLTVAAALSMTAVNAQTANDSVYVGTSSTNNVFYSLANDSVTSVLAKNWHLSFGTAASQFGSLSATVQFNTINGTVYRVPGLDAADFADVDTAGITTWTPLYNSEIQLGGGGALNSVGGTHPDYGFGTYNSISHNVEASRVFVAKLAGNVYVKFKVDLISTPAPQAKYVLTFDNLSNTNTTTQDIMIAPYVTKNFAYFDLVTEQILDREPVSASWDFLMGSYHSLTGTTMYAVAGILQNDGVEAVQVGSVNTQTYVDFQAHTLTEEMNTIGSDWKAYNMQAGVYTITPNTVYFVKAKNTEIWKVVMKGYAGGASGKMAFYKEKMTSLGLDDNGKEIFASLYPNPAANTATVVVNNMLNGKIAVYNMTGALVYSQDVNASGLATVELPVADFANGAYQVVCTSGSAIGTERLIVQH